MSACVCISIRHVFDSVWFCVCMRVLVCVYLHVGKSQTVSMFPSSPEYVYICIFVRVRSFSHVPKSACEFCVSKPMCLFVHGSCFCAKYGKYGRTEIIAVEYEGAEQSIKKQSIKN